MILRHAATLISLSFICLCAIAQTKPDIPTGKPAATIDLATDVGVTLVKGQWRYSDTRIVETKFLAPGADGQPGTTEVPTYDYTPHAGAVIFDDSHWEAIVSETNDTLLHQNSGMSQVER